ncbi:MAG: hypothetical protein PX481_14705 [Microcystis sp. M53603_WE2]|uniref:hypothetical protein n=1 Tax=Microcystis sp. M53602_WE12 TaxID=3030674 RepID=UPI00258F80D3|nr:hypothetical protein [Microcystis sp. M53602_WE12]MDJ0539904.1 hypothetical protein [Microcystis sp. M53603_WE2]
MTEEFSRLAEENRQDQYIVEVGGDECRYTSGYRDHNLDHGFFLKMAVGFVRSLYLHRDRGNRNIRRSAFPSKVLERENFTTYPDRETVFRTTDRSIPVRNGKRKRER